MAQIITNDQAQRDLATEPEIRKDGPPSLIPWVLQKQNSNADVDIIAIGNGETYIWEEKCDVDKTREAKLREEEAKPEKGTQKKPLAPEDLNWLRNPRMLPCVVPRSRIFEFFYSKKDAHIQNLKNLTECFLRHFSEIEPARPVIFITYGYGSLLLELAVMLSYSKPIATSSLTPSNPAVDIQHSEGTEENKLTKNFPQTPPLATNVDKQPTPHHEIEPKKLEPGILEVAKTRSIDLNLVAGILLLGSPREVPLLLTPKGTNVFKTKELGDPKTVGIKELLEVCVKTEFKKTKEAEPYDSGGTIYHSCFEMIVNEVGIATQCYQGAQWNDLPALEGGTNFKVRQEPNDEFLSLHVSDISKETNARTTPWSRYVATGDFLYMKVRTQVRIFRQEFLFLRAARKSSNTELTELLGRRERPRINPNKPRVLGKTALHIATEQGNEGIVTTLISRYANLSAKTADGKTALRLAVDQRNPKMVEFLLTKGALSDLSSKSRSELLSFLPPLTEAEPKAKEIITLLNNPPLVDGPSLSTSEHYKKPQEDSDQEWPQDATQPDEVTACRSFDITIGHFFLTKAGDEKSDITLKSVYDLLYATELKKDICEPILRKADAVEKDLSKTGFTWYHVPANNIDWVEGVFAQLGMQDLLPLDIKEHRGVRPWASKIIPSAQQGTDGKSLSLFLPFLNVETSNNRKEMSKVIKQAGKRREPDEDWLGGRNWYGRWRYGSSHENSQDQSSLSADACLIQAYMKESKGLHVRRTLDQSHYSMLPSTEERDVDQILLKRGRLVAEENSQNHQCTADVDKEYSDDMDSSLSQKKRHHITVAEWMNEPDTQEYICPKDESSLKVVMVGQLWLWMFEDTLITSFPRSWGQNGNESKSYDLLADILQHIRHPREEPFTSVEDVAIMIVQRCSTIFTSDPKLLFPLPLLLELYQEVIGDVSAKEASFFRTFNKNLTHLSLLYNRVESQDKRTKRKAELKFREFLFEHMRQLHENPDSELSDTDEEDTRLRRRTRAPYDRSEGMHIGDLLRKYLIEMVKDPETQISKLLDSFNDITKEASQLIEIKDIIDELNMLGEVQKEQTNVLGDFTAALDKFLSNKLKNSSIGTTEKSEDNNFGIKGKAQKDSVVRAEKVEENKQDLVVTTGKNEDLKNSGLKGKPQKETPQSMVKEKKIPLSRLVLASKRAQDMKQFVEKGEALSLHITTLSDKANVTLKAITQLLELKQKQANASEARTSRIQAEQSKKQGQTLMVFTTVTIIFLPLSFMTAFFAIPVSDWPKHSDGTSALDLSFVSRFIFPISVAVILVFLIIAFKINGITEIFDSWKIKTSLSLMDVPNPWKKLLIIILWITFPILYPTLRIIHYARRVWRALIL